ncbi:hypothetical protein EVAR_80756_1 [Eumeta japonica]|uniref:Uncharacterized protein n=1 Tax=Eumeta variegata TaxID=151549 RepID=A0A4C1XAR2_EUMVA|nr:hypothetical protein EVAR_80756_1 [Eumeta japonica]
MSAKAELSDTGEGVLAQFRSGSSKWARCRPHTTARPDRPAFRAWPYYSKFGTWAPNDVSTFRDVLPESNAFSCSWRAESSRVTENR